MKSFNIILAHDSVYGIGKNGVLPWDLPKELKYFNRVTKTTENAELKNAVIMGRKTWESIPEKFRPLPGRINVVVTRNDEYVLPENVLRANSLDAALAVVPLSGIENVFVIGGAQLCKESIAHVNCGKLFLTEIEGDFSCDTFLPKPADDFEKTWESEQQEEGDVKYRFTIYERKD